jgi:iron-sulfur cluster assembly accessory protein
MRHAGHAVSSDYISRLYDRLIQMSVETEHTVQPVSLTERAARRIAEILKEEPQNTMLRLAVTGGGCSGFQYDFCLDASRADDDLVIARGAAVVLIDPVSLDFLKGSEIDFIDEMIGASFKVTNPNATASCGCGTSFSV